MRVHALTLFRNYRALFLTPWRHTRGSSEDLYELAQAVSTRALEKVFIRQTVVGGQQNAIVDNVNVTENAYRIVKHRMTFANRTSTYEVESSIRGNRLLAAVD
jgi:hypothetical protein